MSIDIAASLNERQRNALLSYYMGQYIPASGNDALINLVQTPEDVYEYLLIDPLVSNAVPTSRVAQAMSSIQQYINGITMNMEPGYQTQYLDQDNINSWKGGLSQYDIWAGEVELDTYPENYIDPTLRQSQTAYFKDLITDLNQNTINNDTAQQAVMNYLNKFEQAANLTIVSGYLDSTDQTTGTYYFLGKSTTSPVQYYWRSFDMSKNIDNIVSTDAWSEWYLMNTAINEDALQGRPRLAYFNNRLYLFWFEKTTGGNATENEANENNSNTFDVINAYSSFCDFSNNWSSPYTMMSVDNDLNGSGHENYCDALFTSGVLNTACGYNQNEDTITISLYCAGSPASESNDYNDFSIEIDYWFNLSRIKAESDDGIVTILSQFLDCYFDKDLNEANQKKIQSIYQYGLFEVASLELQDSGEYKSFVNSRLTLSALNKEDFSINYKEDGSFTVNVTVPGSSIPKAYSSSADCYAGSDTGVFYYDFIPSGHNLKRMSITMEEAVSASYDRIG